MTFHVAHFLYNLALPAISLLTAPAWLLKMIRRGGWGSGLLERLTIYDRDPEFEKGGAVYVHAVSVGEVLLALKLIKAWHEETGDHFVLVPTTATGMAVAKEKAPGFVRVIYAPVDLPLLVRRAFDRFQPRAIVLMESELWPNLIIQAHRLKIPIGIANARLSPRSGKRLSKLKKLVSPMISKLHRIGVPEESDVARWHAIGARPEATVVTGNVKFDPLGSPPQKREEFGDMLSAFGDQKIGMAVSTFSGEEKFISSAFRKVGLLPVVVPRHAERRAEVSAALEGNVVLRSAFSKPEGDETFVIDSTGELRDWTAHADAVVVGKSFLAEGGQNPTEAIQAGIPVICGPHMANFEPLVSELKDAEAIWSVTSEEELVQALREAIVSPSAKTKAATRVLQRHEGAVSRTIALF
ncbi:MAG: 3-deoxy-D-manno-octulosonic acid transferase [Akkermansiaceae bacterium]